MTRFRLLLLLFCAALLFLQCGTAPSPAKEKPEGDLAAEQPAAGEQPGPVAEPEQQALPPPGGEFLRYALEQLRGPRRPVLGSRGAPVAEIWDAGEYRICVVLCAEDEKSYRFDTLSDLSRLYDPESRLVFSIAVLVWQPDRIMLEYFIPLGEFPMVERFSAGPFGGSAAPDALIVDFQSSDGGEEFIIFAGPRSGRTLRIRQNSASFARRRDLDGDGIDDVLIYEAIYEEGTGKETFITWYRWNGTELAVHRTTNIVRNLNAFLKNTSLLLEKGRFDEFVDRYLSPENAPAVLRELPFFESFHRVFMEDPQVEQHISLDEEAFRLVKRVAFPEILENPFDISSGDFRLELPVHFIGERDYRYLAGIEMNDNPFGTHQFFFRLAQP